MAQADQAELRARIGLFLAEQHVMTLATHGPQGLWAAAVFYASDGTDLYFLSSPTSRHGLNLQGGCAVAATIQPDYRDWPGIRGVQLEGDVILLGAGEAGRAREVYARKFPVVGTAARAPSAIVAALAKVNWYRVRPTRLFFVDNTRGFGHRDELEL